MTNERLDVKKMGDASLLRLEKKTLACARNELNDLKLS